MTFYDDVICRGPLFKSPQRVSDIGLLEPITRAAVSAIVAEARSVYGIDLIVFETYRSEVRQLRMFEQGASKLKNVGVHHFGLACDIVKSIHGEPSWKGNFDFLGALAASHKLIWGGNWGHATPSTFRDLDHVQRCSIRMQHGLLSGAWYPDAAYDPLAN